MEPSKEAIEAALQRAHMKLSAYIGVCKDDKELPKVISLVEQASFDFAMFNAEYEGLLVDRNKLLAEFQKARAELQTARKRIEELEAGEQEPWDMPDASPTYAELEQQLQAANKRILELERNAAAAANMYSSLLEQLEDKAEF